MKTHAVNNGGGGFGRKGLSWKVKQETRWAAVRESYLVVVSEIGEVSFYFCSQVSVIDKDIARCLGCFSFRS